MQRAFAKHRSWTYRLPAVVMLTAAASATACSNSTPPPETLEHRDGREMGIAFREEGAWPDISRSRAESLCRSTAQLEGYDQAGTDDYIAGCTDELLTP
ncbi:hypothetical protein [Streptomyces sp. NPDC093089]|uniref:hypothetical protein n=1 Tax=Streptomyces sp. NPDC093089 TaxID=3366024 RepID=UPI00381A6913